MSTRTELYQIDGQPMIAPDDRVEMSFSDLDSADSGRDESGVMHRFVVRRKVGSWNFRYSRLSAEDYRYMLGILPTAGCFFFAYPGGSCQAYLSNFSVTWEGLPTDGYRDLKFSIIQC